MERTYKHTITTTDGETQELDIKHMTMRHGLRLQKANPSEAIETILDMVAPGVLDIISPESLMGLSEAIMEHDKSFFDQLAKIQMASLQIDPNKVKNAKKAK